LQAEAILLNEKFIKRNKRKLYNRNGGGKGSWIYNNYFEPNREKRRKKALKCLKYLIEHDEFWRKIYTANISKGLKDSYKKGRIPGFLGKKHTRYTRKLIGLKNSISLKGNRNPQYGKTWISNIKLKKSISINKELLSQYLNNGWIIGMEFHKPYPKGKDSNSYGRIWIYNKKSNKYLMIYPKQFSKYQIQGWIKQKFSSNSGKYWINNGINRKMVTKKEMKSYLKNGWNIGLKINGKNANGGERS